MNHKNLLTIIILTLMVTSGCKVVISNQPPAPIRQPTAISQAAGPDAGGTVPSTSLPAVSPPASTATATDLPTASSTATQPRPEATSSPVDNLEAVATASVTPVSNGAEGAGQSETGSSAISTPLTATVHSLSGGEDSGSKVVEEPTATSSPTPAIATIAAISPTATLITSKSGYEVSAASMEVAPAPPTVTNDPSTVTPTPVPTATPKPGEGSRLASPATAESATNEQPTVRETIITLDTYGYKKALVPTSPEDPVYPYPRLNHDQVGPPLPQEYRAIILENRYLELTILPDLGGRIYRWIDKASGQNLFYENPVIKPTGWGHRGWWLATGGMEWALPLDEHGLSEASPWDYSLYQTGSNAGVFLTDTEEHSGLIAEITISLDADHAYFTLDPRIVNPTDKPVTYKFWLNGMFGLGSRQPGPGLEFVLPGRQVTVHSTGDPSLPGQGQPMDWPVFAGRDFSNYGNWTHYLGVFAAPSAQDGYMGAYNHQTNLGVVRVFPHLLARGAKIFAPGDLDPALWTTDGSGYFELWGGLAPTFGDEVTLDAGQWVAWQEHWYAIGDMGGFNFANAEAALNLKPADSTVEVAAASSRLTNGQLILWQNGSEAARWGVTLAPEHPFRGNFSPLAGQAGAWGLSLLDETGREIAATGQTGLATAGVPTIAAIPAAAKVPAPTPIATATLPFPTPTPNSSDQPPTPTSVPTPGVATPTVAPLYKTSFVWDPRLNDLGIKLNRAEVEAGQPVYRLVAARFQDESEARGLHHVFVEVLDENGRRIIGQPVALAWKDGQGTMMTEDKPQPEYAASAPLYGAMDKGTYDVYVEGAASDRISGLGLPGKHHVSYQLIFQRGVATANEQLPSLPTQPTTPTPEPTPTPVPATPGSNGQLSWDPRLDDLGITLTQAQPEPGQPVYRLVAARYQDDNESHGLHHVFVEVLDENGQRIVGQPVTLAWSDGKGTMITEDKPYPEYAANAPLYGMLGEANYDVYVEGAPSDRISGLGLPGKHHVSYLLTFQRKSS